MSKLNSHRGSSRLMQFNHDLNYPKLPVLYQHIFNKKMKSKYEKREKIIDLIIKCFESLYNKPLLCNNKVI